MIIHNISDKKEVDMTNKFNILNKGDVSIMSKINYIKRGAKYIIGAGAMIAGFSSAAFGLDKDVDGYYKIGSSADFKEFASKVNNGEYDANGKLMNDIICNEGGVVENEKLKKEMFENWTPIGTDNNPFEGKFKSNDGIMKITGIYVNNEGDNYQGLFGVLGRGGEVSNIEIVGSYIGGNDYIGGIVGENRGKINKVKVTNSYIKGKASVGGNVGRNECDVLDCENKGSIIKGKYDVGGNVGCNNQGGHLSGEFINTGTVKGESSIGGNIGGTCGCVAANFNNGGKVEGYHLIYDTEGNLREVSCSIGGNIGHCGGEVCYGKKLRIFKNDGNVKGDYAVGGNIGDSYNEIRGEFKNNGDVQGREKVGMNIGDCRELIGGVFGGKGKVNGKHSVHPSGNLAEKFGKQNIGTNIISI